MTAAEVFRAAMELTPAEREELARALLDSVEGGSDLDEVDAVWRTEIRSRIAEIRGGQIAGLTHDEVKSLLAERRAARSV